MHSRNLSHVLMDGGCLSVPFDKLRAFNEKYVDACQRGEKVFVVEQKTDTYNFFVDIDYKDTDPLSLEDIQDIARIICDKVRRHGGHRCLVSVAEPKLVDGQRYKTGVHLNWPGMVVDQASAVALREHILVVLYTAKGEAFTTDGHGFTRIRNQQSAVSGSWFGLSPCLSVSIRG